MEKNIEEKHKIVVREISEKSNKKEMEMEKDKKEGKTVSCPYCGTIITFKDRLFQRILVKCPTCGKKGAVLSIGAEKKFKRSRTEKAKMLRRDKKRYADKSGTCPPKVHSFIKSNIIALVLTTIGIILLFDPIISNIKISFTLIFIGLILVIIHTKENISPILLKNDKRFLPFKKKHHRVLTKRQGKGIRNSFARSNFGYLREIKPSMSDKITLALIIWILFLFFITGDADLEVFFVLIFIGMLVLKELTDESTTTRLKHKMDGFIYVFLIVFIWIIGEKIINALNM